MTTATLNTFATPALATCTDNPAVIAEIEAMCANRAKLDRALMHAILTRDRKRQQPLRRARATAEKMLVELAQRTGIQFCSVM